MKTLFLDWRFSEVKSFAHLLKLEIEKETSIYFVSEAGKTIFSDTSIEKIFAFLQGYQKGKENK